MITMKIGGVILMFTIKVGGVILSERGSKRLLVLGMVSEESAFGDLPTCVNSFLAHTGVRYGSILAPLRPADQGPNRVL
jgi:hypothetical protein